MHGCGFLCQCFYVDHSMGDDSLLIYVVLDPGKNSFGNILNMTGFQKSR